MRTYFHKIAATVFLIAFAASAVAQEEANPCANKDGIDIATLALGEAPVEEVAATAPDASNASAGGTSGVAGSLVDSADRPRLVALAMDAGLLSESEGAATLTVSPFLWAAIANPDVRVDQAEYKKYELARRITGKVTWGGKGDAFDRDGDGTVDDALTTTSASDMVSYELAFRLFGSRDRREAANYQELVDDKAYVAARDARNNAALGLVEAGQVVVNGELVDPQESPDACKLVQAQVRRAVAAGALKNFKDAEAEMIAITQRWAEKVDTRTLVSLVASGTERDEKFGGDKRSFGIRASMGKGDISKGGYNHNLELDYLRNELPNGRDNLEGIKLGYEFNRLYKTFPMFGWKDATLSGSVAVEKYSDVPSGMADSIAKAQAKVTFKINDNLKMPFSITWANRSSLLDHEKDVIGHIGISYDFDSFFAKPGK